MPGVEETKLSPEQRQLEQVQQTDKEEEFVSKLTKSLDLPATLSDAVEEGHKQDSKSPKQVEEEAEAKSEEDDEDEEDTEDDSTEEEDSANGETQQDKEEDLIPKSKVQKRIDALTREKRMLESRLTKLEETHTESTKDDDTTKLEKMGEDELKNLKRQVRLAQVKSATDEVQLAKLLDLEEKIEGVMKDTPKRFVTSQVSNFNRAVEESTYDSDIKDFDKASKDIFGLAKSIFDDPDYSDLRKSPTGQAVAWKMAVKHYKAISNLNAGKSKTEELERQVNTLKKKVSTDTGTGKQTAKQDDSAKLFKKAKYGNDRDRTNFMRKVLNTDDYIPEELLR